MIASGWAATERGEIAVDTVSPTRRAAIVNWLVTRKKELILADTTDAQTEAPWFKYYGERDVKEVTIETK